MNSLKLIGRASLLSLVYFAWLLLAAQGQTPSRSVSGAPKATLARLKKENRELKKRVGLLQDALVQSKSRELKLQISHSFLWSELKSRLPVVSTTPGKVPTVRLAIMKALEVSRKQRLFGQPEPRDARNASSPEYLYFQKVEILGSKQANGSVRVTFNRVTESVGRKLLEVAFTKTDFTPKFFDPESRTRQVSNQEEAMFSKAVSVACSMLPNSSRMEFVASIIKPVSTTEEEAFDVMIQQNFPGGGAIYKFSKTGDLTAILPGL